VHEVVVSAEAVGSNHKGRVQVNSVVIDGIEVPGFVLELFVDKYVTPRYPEWGWIRRLRFPTRSNSDGGTTCADDRAEIARPERWKLGLA